MAGRFLTNLAHTEHGAILELTEEQEDKCRVVYRRSEEKPDIYIFDSLWDPDVDYSDEHIIVPLRSTYDGLSDEYKAETCFTNVQGSNSDKKYPKIPPMQYDFSWIEIIRRAYAANGENYSTTSCCAEQGRIYRFGRKTPEKISCSDRMHGAHVLMEVNNTNIAGPHTTVYLLPLCSEHNTHSLSGTATWGTGYYMKLGCAMKAVKLRGYMQNPEPGTLP